MTPHPQDFYTAHRVFTGRAFPNGPVWGALTDGPEDLEDVLERLWGMRSEAWGEMPTRDVVMIWHFQDDVPPRDVTEDVLALLADMAERAT
jgi:hypothetical protein